MYKKTCFINRFFIHVFSLFEYIHEVFFSERERERERGQWSVYYTRPQSLIQTFSFSLAQQLWGLLANFDWLVY